MENLVQKSTARPAIWSRPSTASLPRDLEKSFNAGERNVYTTGCSRRAASASSDDRGPLRRNACAAASMLCAPVRAPARHGLGSAPGRQHVEACLASESGKLYVTLAEAAGRIPPQ
jgi:hypothetical protein